MRIAVVVSVLVAALSGSIPLGAQSWCTHTYRPGYEALERVRVSDPWFHVFRIERDVFAIYEPFNFQEIISYLIVGAQRAVLFDTGMGMSRISALVRQLTTLPVTVVNSHTHYDHIGGNAEFADIRSMDTEYTREGAKGVKHREVAAEVAPNAFCARQLRVPFDTAAYHVRPFRPAGVVSDSSVIDLGGRRLEVLHVPGHTPDAVALLERARGFLWTGDTFYPGPIWLFFPATDLDAYGKSIARLAALAPSLQRVFPGHNLPYAQPEILPRVRDLFARQRAGQLSFTKKDDGLVDYPGDGFSFLMRAPEPPLRVLFIGNSYTYYNNVPGIVADFARFANTSRTIAVDMVVRGGATLRDHWTSGDALAKLRLQSWDYVVLQEQSMLGVMLENGQPTINDPEFFHRYARLFTREIAAAGAKPVFYLTWSRKATPGLQERLTLAYASIARETGGLLAPVGPVWQRVRLTRPGLELYDRDGSHPSPAGSYLAATTLWATIAGQPPRGLPSVVRGRILVDTGLGSRFTDSVGRLVTLADSDAALIQRTVGELMGQAGVSSALDLSAPNPGAASQALSRVLSDVMRHRVDESISLRLQRGLPVGKLPDISLAAWRREAAFWRGITARTALIRAAQLGREEQLSLRAVRWEAKLSAEKEPFYWVDFSLITPYATPLQDVQRAFAGHVLRTPADAAAYLALLRKAPAFADSLRAGLVSRAARGIYLAREEIPQSEALVRTFIGAGTAGPFAVAEARLGAIDVGEREAFTRLVAAEITERINPAFQRLAEYLAGDYSTRAPVRVGVGQYPNGKAFHRWLVRWHTTIEVTPERVHRVGLEEVARINREMAAIRAELAFRGTKAEFHAQLKTDPRFFAKVPEEFGERLTLYARRIEPRLGEFFGRQPRAKGDVRRLAPNLEPAMTFGYYQVPTATDSMGHYFYNGTSLSERTLLTAGPLVAHELWPGHHFQVNLAKENATLPEFRREAYYTAFGEGWGDYAAIVAGEMGMYRDAYDRYGRLAMDMFISCRLVVDTGMNSLGWSRERAMEYMRANLLESETQIRSESLRYSADLPGQALAYKMGSREFERLRRHAQQVLGSRFDIRQFHDMLLGSGMLPMNVLAQKVEWFLQSSR